MVNATEIFPLRSDICVIALLARPDSQVQVTIAEVDVGAATPPNLRHPEHVFVEGRDLLQVVRGQGYMLDFCHALSPQDAPVLGWVATRLRRQSGMGYQWHGAAMYGVLPSLRVVAV
jgi:hypothetical protein